MYKKSHHFVLFFTYIYITQQLDGIFKTVFLILIITKNLLKI